MGLFKSSKKRTPKSTSTSSTAYTQHQENKSSSNLSTTSTLCGKAESRPQGTRRTSYEEFLGSAREGEARRQEKLEKEEQMVRAWIAAQKRRDRNGGRSSDPWRGGFGMRAVESEGVKGWLGQNGLVKK